MNTLFAQFLVLSLVLVVSRVSFGKSLTLDFTQDLNFSDNSHKVQVQAPDHLASKRKSPPQNVLPSAQSQRSRRAPISQTNTSLPVPRPLPPPVSPPSFSARTFFCVATCKILYPPYSSGRPSPPAYEPVREKIRAFSEMDAQKDARNPLSGLCNEFCIGSRDATSCTIGIVRCS